MRYIILTILIFLSSICFSQITNYGPSVGVVSDDIEIGGYQFGFSVRHFNKDRFIQPEVNLISNKKYTNIEEIRVPVLFGIKFIQLIRVNVGLELRTPLIFSGNNNGLNKLNYNVSDDKTYIRTIGGIGIDFDKICIDFRILQNDSNFKRHQYSLSVYYLFGKRKEN